MMSEKIGPIKLPEQKPKLSSATADQNQAQAGIDFKSLLAASNTEHQKELKKQKEAVGGDGSFHISETKNDKEFREMLEKVTGKKETLAKNKMEKDDYLKLMVTQMQNQDPLKPMDNQQMATQLAAFNQVEQLMGVNSKLDGLGKAQEQEKAEKLTHYLGKSLQMSGNKLHLSQDGSISQCYFELGVPSGTANLSIKDAAGNSLRTIALGGLAAGDHKVTWDGKDDKGQPVLAGDYTFSLDAASADGKKIEVKTYFSSRVNSVKDMNSGGKLTTALGAVDWKDVRAITEDESIIN